jgi:uncharacterized protein (TIGR03067 family)
MKLFISGGMVALFVVSGLVYSGDAKKDNATFQGNWVFEKNGRKISMQFKEGKFTIAFDGKEAKGTFKLDPDKKPKQIDMTITDFEEAKVIGKVALGIYDFDGETLKWCANSPGREGRPETFPDNPGEGKYLYALFKRVK